MEKLPIFVQYLVSLSARRAWIEIQAATILGEAVEVALRKESVDRNKHYRGVARLKTGRSPQGERG